MIRNEYPGIVFCTLPEQVEGDRIVYTFEYAHGMLDVVSCFLEPDDSLQGISPLYVCRTIAQGLAWLDSLQPPTQADLDYIAAL